MQQTSLGVFITGDPGVGGWPFSRLCPRDSTGAWSQVGLDLNPSAASHCCASLSKLLALSESVSFMQRGEEELPIKGARSGVMCDQRLAGSKHPATAGLLAPWLPPLRG